MHNIEKLIKFQKMQEGLDGGSTHLLEELIKIDSSTKSGANEAIAYCEQWLIDQGLPVEKLENNGFHMLVCEIGQRPYDCIKRTYRCH